MLIVVREGFKCAPAHLAVIGSLALTAADVGTASAAEGAFLRNAELIRDFGATSISGSRSEPELDDT